MIPDPAPPAEPRAPRLPAAAQKMLDTDELDERYPDIDGVALDGARLVLSEARTVDVLRCRLRRCAIDVADDAVLEVRDSVLDGIELTGRRITGLVRTHLIGCRVSGADLAEATIEDVTFEDCALDSVSWRFARVRRVAVRGGRLDGLDASGAQLEDVSFASVALQDVILDQARCRRVDVIAADIGSVTTLSDLAGATIGPAQAVSLAPRLARELGLVVRPDDPD